MESYECPHCRQAFSADPLSNTLLHCPHCNGMVNIPSDNLKSGDSLGGFEIIRIIGKGGMGNVYLAKQSSMQRLVAMKVLSKAVVSDKNVFEQFQKEVQLSGQLNHPNIVKAIDAGENENCYFMAVAYIEGDDFEKIIDRGTLIPEKEAFEIGFKISDALNYAWEKYRLLHKDIKPGNIMRNKKGEIFLMDLGIAQHTGLGSVEMEHIFGSPFYMSPEQGQGLALDWRTDLYSLGATLYHMMVGLPPYDAKDLTKIIEKHITDPFPLPHARNPDSAISRGAVSILKKMMEKKPEDRYSSWADFQSAAKIVMLGKRETGGNVPRKNFVMNRNVPAKRSSFRAVVALINAGLAIVVGCTAAYMLYSYNKNSRAVEDLKDAENYYRKYPYDYEGVVSHFTRARKAAKGTKSETKIAGRCQKVLESAEAFRIKAENFDSVLKKATALYAKREFQQAVDLLDPLKDIEDPARKKAAYALLNRLQMMLNPPKKE